MAVVNPLANPKGIKLLCHLCQKPARYQCTQCRVTYYCTSDHQHTDWEAIHQQVCELIGVLRATPPHASSDGERLHRQHQQKLRKEHIVSISLIESRKHLYSGDHAKAFPPALLALRLLSETYGAAHLELTPALLVLAQSAIGCDKLREAEQYLSQAQWAVMKAENCSAKLKSQLHRNLGLLAFTCGQYTEARKQLAEDIYQSSVAHGASAVQTAGGLYHMGNVFMKEGKPIIALSFMDQVVIIWMKHLESIITEIERALRTKSSSVQLPSDAQALNAMPRLGVPEQVEALHMLNGIQSQPELMSLSTSSTLTLSLQYTLALLYTTVQNYSQAESFLHKASTLLGPHSNHPCQTDVEKLSFLLSELKKNA